MLNILVRDFLSLGHEWRGDTVLMGDNAGVSYSLSDKVRTIVFVYYVWFICLSRISVFILVHSIYVCMFVKVNCDHTLFGLTSSYSLVHCGYQYTHYFV